MRTLAGAELKLAAGRVEARIVAVIAQFWDCPGWSVDASMAKMARVDDHLRRMVDSSWDHVRRIVIRRRSRILQLKSALVSH